MFTDHETLKNFIQTKQLSRRQVRWAQKLQDYDFVILPIPGKQNQRADALTRREQDLPQSAQDERVRYMHRPLLDASQFKELTPDIPVLAPLDLPVPPLIERLREANRTDPSLRH